MTTGEMLWRRQLVTSVGENCDVGIDISWRRGGTQWIQNYRDANTATRTMNGMYVRKEIPAMIRHRKRHDLASAAGISETMVLAT